MQFHILVATGMTLVIVAVANLMSGGSVSANKKLLDAGSALICLAWFFLSFWALLSTYNMRRSSVPNNLRGGKTVSTRLNSASKYVEANVRMATASRERSRGLAVDSAAAWLRSRVPTP